MRNRRINICLKILGTCMILLALLTIILPNGFNVYLCAVCTMLLGLVLLKAKYITETPDEQE